ncbi:MAG: hypothetical protein J6S01_06345 [Bacteroidales bacterium]|nr:hypothetical protein [Bacteroidales bacterium]
MKKNYLLPHNFKMIGLIMLVPFLVACIWLLCGPCEGDWFIVDVPALFTLDLASTSEWFGMTSTDPVNEISMLGLLVSLVFIALSKEKDEDEMTTVVRMQSFVWTFWCTAILMLVAILFVYDLAFMYFAFASVFVCFIMYICKFNYEMIKIRRVQNEE